MLFATTIISAIQRCNIVAIILLFRMVAALFQHCITLLRLKSSLQIVPCNVTLKFSKNKIVIETTKKIFVPCLDVHCNNARCFPEKYLVKDQTYFFGRKPEVQGTKGLSYMDETTELEGI